MKVNYLDADTFTGMLQAVRDRKSEGVTITLSDEELAQIDDEVAAIKIPDAVLELVAGIRSDLQAKV